MAVEIDTSRVSYTGAGTTGPFTIPFYFINDADIRAIQVTIADGTEEELVLTTDFSLTGAGDEEGGELTLVDSLSSSYKLVIFRDPEILQEASFPRNDPFPAATNERVVDLLTMIAQRQSDLLERSLRLPEGDTSGQSMVLPAEVDRVSVYPYFNASGELTVSAGTTTDSALRTDLADDSGASLVAFIQSGTGLVTTVEAFLNNPTFYSSAKADGETFYDESGETVFAESADQTEASQTGTGTDFDPSTTYVAIKFTTSSSASFIQGIELRVKKTGSLTDTSALSFALYTDSGGAPDTLLSSGGQIFAGQVTASYVSLYAMLQNVTNALSDSTTYWVVITRSESGGDFVLDSAAGSGSLYAGAALGALSDTSKVAYYKIYARSEYPVHTVGKHTHGVWGVSVTGVGVRGDSTSHYGVYGQSVTDPGVRGTSTYEAGVLGTSTSGNGVEGTTAATAAHGVVGSNTALTGGYAGGSFSSVSGPAILASTTETGNGALLRGIRSFQGIQFGPSGTIIADAAAVPTSGQYFAPDILWNTSPSARGGAAFWKCVTSGVPGLWAAVNLKGVSDDNGDAAATLTVGADAETQIWASAIGADRAVTLDTAGAYNGAEFHITRKASATGAFNLNVGTGPLKALAVGTWCVVAYDGSAWFLKQYGAL